MRRHRLILLLVLPLASFAESVVTHLNVPVPMRDGVRLSANVFRPATPGRAPTILIRTPYDKGDQMTPNYRAFVEHGYAVVAQDVRGRYASGGHFEPINQEINDGDDTLNWIASRAWSDGNVGMIGGSYLGIAQWKAAISGNPHLKAIFPYVSGDDDYRDRYYSPGGAMKLGHRLLWMAENMRLPGTEVGDFRKFVSVVPIRKADFAATGQTSAMWQTAANHPDYDDFWKQGSVREHLKDIKIPVYNVGGWYDNYAESDLDAFAALNKRNHNDRVLIGPWPHNMLVPFDRVTFGKGAIVPLRREQFEWLDEWLRGRAPAIARPPVKIYVMGINRWREENEWPLARAKNQKLYLAANGALVDKGEKHSTPDTYTYDPRNPVPTMGGAVCCNQKVFPPGPMDQRSVERRKDVLTYSTAALEQDTEVTGVVKLILFASTSAPDTDFTAKLVDVFPDGEARNLTDGILRLRYRESLEKPKLATPGEVYRLTIDAGVTSNVFRAGHRIRLEVSSSNFPRFDRNPNTGRLIAAETEFRKAQQTVFHESRRQSYLLLPVIPANGGELTSAKPSRYVSKRTFTKVR